jgi:acylphosphatase
VAAAAVMRLRVLFTGRVQGVGFRATTWELARGYQVTGCVRNLPDGRVELEVQGTRGEVAGLLAAVEERFRHNIRQQSEQDVPVVSDEGGFEIGR